MVEYLKRRLKEIPPDVLERRLYFEEHQMIHSFIHSSMFSMKHILNRSGWWDGGILILHPFPLGQKEDTIFHSTFVILIDRNKKSDEQLDGRQSLHSLLRNIDDLLICNIT